MSILALLLFLPHREPESTRVDVVEVNQMCDSKTGKTLFTQVIWWEDTDDGYRVVAWRLLGQCTVRPERIGAAWVSRWWDKKTNRMQAVIARVFRETLSCDDRELWERGRLPCDKRRGLAGERK